MWNKIKYSIIVFILITVYSSSTNCNEEKDVEIDPNGYIAFCPCMGRFGNQLDQFLGTLSFAKDLDRTLVLPNWVEYPEGMPGSIQIPFEDYFQVEPLKNYTKVVLMEHFMKHIAPIVWPKGKRVAFCYGARGNDNTCAAKEGNPFGPYWDKFNIDFDSNAFYGPLSHDLSFEEHKKGWKTKFGPEKYPVLAFTGAPGSFPVVEKDVKLQKYLKWSDKIDSEANKFISKLNIGKDEKIIGIHLRNGIDFKRACDHTKGESTYNFFSSAQCLGYHMEKGKLTYELCYPPEKKIVEQLGKMIKSKEAKHVFIASDDNHMIETFKKKFKNVSFHKNPNKNPKVDLAILGKCDYAIVNCVSSFSAFVKRQRDVEDKYTEFWVFKQSKPNDEL